MLGFFLGFYTCGLLITAVIGCFLRAGDDPVLRAGDDPVLRAGDDPVLRAGDDPVPLWRFILSVVMQSARISASVNYPGLKSGAFLRLSVNIARKGWLTKAQVLNTYIPYHNCYPTFGDSGLPEKAEFGYS